MESLNFNIYAMAKPSTAEDIALCLDEALMLLNELGDQIDILIQDLEKDKK